MCYASKAKVTLAERNNDTCTCTAKLNFMESTRSPDLPEYDDGVVCRALDDVAVDLTAHARPEQRRHAAHRRTPELEDLVQQRVIQ